jgi:hypothetical protein
MPLPVYSPPTRSIPVRGSEQPLIVRGLSFDDVFLLVQAHLPEITQAVEQYRDSLGDIHSQRNMHNFLSGVLTGFPTLVGHLIATAAGVPEEHATAQRYPAGVQLAALTAIVELTMEDASGIADPSLALGQVSSLVLGALAGRQTTSLPDSSGLSVVQ